MLQAIHRYIRAAIFGLLLCGVGLACYATVQAPQPAAKSSAVPPTEATSHAELPKGAVQLSPYNLVLPPVPDRASASQRGFVVSATRAIQRVYQEDADDPSVLLALQEQLRQRGPFESLAAAWQEPINSALTRATTLQQLGSTLRGLRTAMVHAYFDERNKIYRDVDVKGCRAAFAELPPQEESLMGFVVTVEPVGTFPLAKLRTFCAESRSAALRERRLPGHTAPENVSRLVRRLYGHAHLGGQVRKVAVTGTWVHDAQQERYTIKAVVGVLRPEADGEPCSMAEVSVIRPERSGEQPIISEVGEREPIMCSQLK